MCAAHQENHPADYDWRSRFPDAEPVLAGESAPAYTAELDDGHWLIVDEGTMVDFLDEEDQEMAHGLVKLTRYDERRGLERAVADLHARVAESPAEKLLIRALPEIGARLERVAEKDGLARVNERDHLQRVTFAALTELAAASPGELEVRSAWPLSVADWPRLGSVDIAITRADGPPALVELKCGSGSDALGPCAWDLLKLATALSRGGGSAGYLLGATTRALWERPLRGAELLDSGRWDTKAIRSAYADWWRHWEKHNDPRPIRVPSRGETVHIGTTRFELGPSSWELRLAEVRCDPGKWSVWDAADDD